MKNIFISLFSLCIFFTSCTFTNNSKINKNKNPKALVQRMVETCGGVDRLRNLKDVQYVYTYRDNENNKEDKSIERYIFDGELSWAKYTKHEKFVMPNVRGDVIQAFDGKKTSVMLKNQKINDSKEIKTADFLRKTNYYWFTMMFKLLDSGTKYKFMGEKIHEGNKYDLVQITYEENIGDVADTYILYINQETKLVDSFLFTVMDFNIKDPLLMKVEYEKHKGLLLPTKRKYTQSNWDGDIVGKYWNDEISEEISFSNNFSKKMFKIH